MNVIDLEDDIRTKLAAKCPAKPERHTRAVTTSRPEFLSIIVMFRRYACHLARIGASHRAALPVFQVGSAELMACVGNQGPSWTAARGIFLTLLALGAISLLTSCNYATMGTV